MKVFAALLVLGLLIDEARAERGHEAYSLMVQRAKLHRLQAKVRAAYSCKGRGTALFTVEQLDADGDADGPGEAWRLDMYRSGALRFAMGEQVVDGCLPRRVNDHVRWHLANISWRTRPAPCAGPSTTVRRFGVNGRVRFTENDCGPSLAPASRERLAEAQTLLEAALRRELAPGR